MPRGFFHVINLFIYEHRNIKQLVTGSFLCDADTGYHGFNLHQSMSDQPKERQGMVDRILG